MSIRSGATLRLSTFDAALVPDPDASPVTIDLSEFEFIDVFGLVGIASHILEARLAGREVELRVPKNPDVAAYVARMYLGLLLDATDVELDAPLPVVEERDQRGNLIELKPFNSTRGSEELGEYLWHRLADQADGALVTQIYEAAGELGNNVIEHANCPAGGYMAAQCYRRGQPDEYVIMAVGDAGIGIQESLRPRYGPMTETEAIERALQPFVSGTNDPHRGQGLPDIVEGVTGFGGIVYVRSGSAGRWITRDGVSSNNVSRLRGTIVGAKVPCRPGR